MARHLGLSAIPLAALLFAELAAGGFLKQQPANVFDDAKQVQADILRAVEGVRGCGGHIHEDQLPGIESVLTPIWRSLPKNTHGRIERGMLRYISHRYFMQELGVMVRGLEPTRKTDGSDLASAHILMETVPGMVEAVFEAEDTQDHGFGLQDVVHVVATIEEMIWDTDFDILDKVYIRSHRSTSEAITQGELQEVLEDYLVYWIFGDQMDVPRLLSDRTRLPKKVRNWKVISQTLNGIISGLAHKRQHTLGRNGLDDLFTFDDAHLVVVDMLKSWSAIHQAECDKMRNPLLQLDRDRTGRAPLSKFYGAGGGYVESEEYLREVGVLEENSHLGGKQVLIANYLQMPSNCMVETSHYSVCCDNPCDEILGHIEAVVASPVASPIEVLELVGNMSVTDIMSERPLQLSKPLVAQLGSIATKHNGNVPLHGRRFAQWLHYVFPRECAFPHKLGTVSSVRHTEFGDAAIVTENEQQRLAEAGEASGNTTNATSSQWNFETQWSSEEELLADYGSDLQVPWENRRSVSTTTSLSLAVLAALGGLFWKASGSKEFTSALPVTTASHQHMV